MLTVTCCELDEQFPLLIVQVNTYVPTVVPFITVVEEVGETISTAAPLFWDQSPVPLTGVVPVMLTGVYKH
jgi:hypothetical protein